MSPPSALLSRYFISHGAFNGREGITVVSEHIKKVRAFKGQRRLVKAIESCPIKHSFHAKAFMIAWMITSVKLNFYGKHSCLTCHRHVFVPRHLRKAIGCVVLLLLKKMMLVLGMFRITAVYDAERVINISELMSHSHGRYCDSVIFVSMLCITVSAMKPDVGDTIGTPMFCS